jgi:TonB-linked SusC/RagA family outer membrane protein
MRKIKGLWQRPLKLFALFMLLHAFSFIAAAQVVVSGKVTGSDGRPLPYASVQILNTSAGASTSESGDYSVTATLRDGTHTVRFTGVGLKTVDRNIDVGATKTFTIDVQLLQDVLGLSEVIVTGTAVATEKKKFGNAISTVSARELQYSAATSIDGALQGKVAGAQITQNSGNPAGGISVRLRGPSTIIGSSDPLYIVDGVIVNNDSRQLIDLGGYAQNRLVDINPTDIERVEVIKGAAAAAIYGSRANNGVVQIFTKRGRTGAPQVSFSTQFKTNSIRKKLDHNEYPFRFANTTVTDTSRVAVQRYDYQDRIFRTGIGTENNLSVSGGTETTKYYASLSNFFNEGIVDATNFNRNGLRVNLSQKMGKIFTLSMGVNYTVSSSREIPNGGLLEAYGALTGFIFSNNFIDPSKNPVTGEYPSTAPIAILRRTNPLEAIDRFDFRQRVNRFTGNVQLNIKPGPGWNIDFITGIDNYTQISTAYIPPKNTTPSYNGGLARRADATIFQVNNDLNASYRKKLNDWLESTSALGGTLQYQRAMTFGASAQTLGAFGETINNGTIVAGESRAETSIVGAYAQQTFGLKDKIYITGAARVDASSVYGADNRWQFFPKVSGTYIISEEDFWINSKAGELFPLMKVRAAWGQSGNLTAIGPYQRLAVYNPVPYGGAIGYVADPSMGNPGLLPERQKELELGVDFSMFKERLSAEFTWFSKDVEALLLNRTLAPSTGYVTRVLNVGTMTNKGFEFLIRGVPVDNKNLQWISSISYTNNKNTVDGVEGNGVLPFAGGFGQVAAVNGYALGAFYSTFFARNEDGSFLLTPGGLPQRERGTQGAKGTYTIGRDANGQPSGAILSKVIGDPNPDHVISFINDLRFGKFNFRMQWDGMFGFDVFNFTRRVGDNANYGGLKGYEAELRGEVPKGSSAALFSIFEHWIEKGDFAKLRELSISYQVSPGIWGLRDMRLTLSGRNLLSIDNYSGYDPETNAAGQENAVRGFDFVEVPIPRVILIGLNINF